MTKQTTKSAKTLQLPDDVAELLQENGMYSAVLELADEIAIAKIRTLAFVANAEATLSGCYSGAAFDAVIVLAQRIVEPYGLTADADTARALCECYEGASL